MKRLWTILIIAVLVTATMPALAQKIETETSDHNQILHLKTALNHLTVIELREPVIQVATGSQSFKVEWRENRVFVQPTEPDASSSQNLPPFRRPHNPRQRKCCWPEDP